MKKSSRSGLVPLAARLELLEDEEAAQRQLGAEPRGPAAEQQVQQLEREMSGLRAQLMMAEVEKVAKERGACKLTLEVLSNNAPAKGSYAKFGFKNYELDPAQGHAEFWERTF